MGGPCACVVMVRLHSNFKFKFSPASIYLHCTIADVSSSSIMATQNFAPAVHSGSRKGRDASQTNLKDGQSITKRLQQDLMTLMVSFFIIMYSGFIILLCLRDDFNSVCVYVYVDGRRSHSDSLPRWRQPVSLGGHCGWRQGNGVRWTQVQALPHLPLSISLHCTHCQVCHSMLSSQR